MILGLRFLLHRARAAATSIVASGEEMEMMMEEEEEIRAAVFHGRKEEATFAASAKEISYLLKLWGAT